MPDISELKSYIPFPKISPISTFPLRMLTKWNFILKRFLSASGAKLGLCGASVLGFEVNGNVRLKLNRSYALGIKGTVLEVPLDRVIFKSLRQTGKWEIEESRFLAEALVRAHQGLNSKVALVDIGANSGLVSLQSMNLADTTSDLILFEPLPKHIAALKYNVSQSKNMGNVTINKFALGDKNKITTIFTQLSNYGNSSLFETVVPESEQIQTEIRVVDTKEYSIKHLASYDSLVIKCDTQGMDPLILSRIPDVIWDKVTCAVVEVWALPEIEIRDVESLMEMWSGFEIELEILSPIMKRKVQISSSDLKKIWMGKSYTAGNLYLTRVC